MKFKFLIFIFILNTALFSEQEELFVRLKTENRLLPMTFTFKTEQPKLNEAYLSKIKNIFLYDLNHSGKTEVASDASYHIDAALKDQTIDLTLSSFQGENHFKPVGLTGVLEKDRKIVHKLVDGIYEAIFNEEGIATTRILFTLRNKHPQKAGTYLSEVWEADCDGANLRQVTHLGNYAVTPMFIPPKPGAQSGSFLYVGYQSGQPKIYLSSLINREPERLCSLGGNQLMPAMTRQRDLIAFVSDVMGNPDLFVIPFDPEKGPLGKPRKIFTAPFASQGTPTFSPDGKQIAFVSNKEGAPRIWVMPVPQEGTPLKEIKPVLLTRLHRECTAPCWSPDGSKIAYCSLSEGVRQIWMYDLDKKSEERLTSGGRNKENPTFSPNGQCILYNTTDADECDIYVLTIKNQKITKLNIDLKGEKHFPSWEVR